MGTQKVIYKYTSPPELYCSKQFPGGKLDDCRKEEFGHRTHSAAAGEGKGMFYFKKIET